MYFLSVGGRLRGDVLTVNECAWSALNSEKILKDEDFIYLVFNTKCDY